MLSPPIPCWCYFLNWYFHKPTLEPEVRTRVWWRCVGPQTTLEHLQIWLCDLSWLTWHLWRKICSAFNEVTREDVLSRWGVICGRIQEQVCIVLIFYEALASSLLATVTCFWKIVIFWSPQELSAAAGCAVPLHVFTGPCQGSQCEKTLPLF